MRWSIEDEFPTPREKERPCCYLSVFFVEILCARFVRIACLSTHTRTSSIGFHGITYPRKSAGIFESYGMKIVEVLRCISYFVLLFILFASFMLAPVSVL